MKNRELILLYQNLNKLGGLGGVKFAYAVSRNITILQSIIESMDKSIKPTTEYLEFDKKRVELVKEYAEKDEKGEPKTEGNEYILGKNKSSFNKAFDKLKKENEGLVKAREQQIKEYNELLDLEGVASLYEVKLDDVPKEITVVQMYGIQAIIKGE